MDPLIVVNGNISMKMCSDPFDHKMFGFWLNGIGMNIIGGKLKILIKFIELFFLKFKFNEIDIRNK